MARTKRQGKHELLLEACKESLTELFSDTTVDQATTKESLNDVRDEIDTLLGTLKG